MDSQVFNELDSLLAAYDQQHVLCCWDQLGQLQRSELDRQVREIDFEQLTALQADRNNGSRELSQQITPPPAIRPGYPRRADVPAESVEEAIAIGEAALRDGRVALILVAGGQASRLGLNGPKALLPIGPLSGRSLLQFSIDRLKALADRYGSEIPLLIMTSPSVHEAILGYLAEHNHFGLAEENCRLFCQGTMPAIDIDSGRILLESPGALALNPDGHGGMVEALGRSGCLDELARRQIDTISYVQVDNPLAQACDPGLIGFHLAANSEMTSQAVQKINSLEKTGNIVAVDDHLEVIEYSELPESLATESEPDGRLRFWAGSIAVHVFSRGLLEEASRQPGWLPFHHARKVVPFMDHEGNNQAPVKENAIKFERFIFDLLPRAQNALIVEVDRSRTFAPVKNPDENGTDTPATAREAIITLHRQWLLDAGVKIDDDVPVEIHPSWALDGADLLDHPGLPAEIHEPVLLTAERDPENTQD